MTAHVDVFVDYVCPFCLLIEPAIEELQRDRDVEVRIRPFELRPDPVPTLRPEDEYLPRVWNDSVYPMSRRVGVPMSLPTISPQPRTEKAFMVLQVAEEHGRAEQYTKAMFSAFFQQDRDIGEDHVILEVATSVGLDAAEVTEALSSPERREKHRAEQSRALGLIGSHVVPVVVIEGQVLRGVPSARRLKKVVDELSVNPGPAEPGATVRGRT